MPFSEERRSFDDTRKRTGSEYLKFTPEYRTVARILNEEARTVWKHFIPQANGGKGFGVVCPNTAPGMNVCPVEQSVAHLPKDDPERKSSTARKRFIVNVLDRTPYTVCSSCNSPTPAKIAGREKVCTSCNASLKGLDFKPLNKVKILEGGPMLFNQQLNPIEEMQRLENDTDITGYDLTFTTQGAGRDKRVNVLPQDPKPLEDDAFIDAETGEEQQLFDLDLVADPATPEEITLLLQGATLEQVNALRGVAA